ncbi:DUF4349 domain-containing protein [Halostreptopolyspora alba]|uniref:DUF4349 domain-containing protein n=1 Tax=Halostreptopolyspora alba TaxID=2487137 RepID=A0A3N0EB96_9ACTN|nr:DUF4349 domain-containing protein [Nocardiopsaceae bacterium YIM 96095]
MSTSAHPRSPSRVVVVLAPVLAVLLLAGCSGDSQQASMQEDSAPQGERAPDGGGAAENGAEGGEAAEDGAEGGEAVAGSDVEVREREVVHTAQLTVETTEIEDAAGSAKEWVVDAGGHVEAESVTTESGDEGPRASLTLRVPTDSYEDALRELGDLGTRADLERRVEDVTEEVADVDSRVESAEATLDRLRELVEEADDVEDVLAVESEISDRQEELEALQARQQALADSVSLGTIELSLLPPDSYLAEEESDSIGFLGGLVRGWRALLSVLEGAAVALGWSLPFLAVVAVAVVPVLVWRRRRAATETAVVAEPSGDPRPEPVGEGDGDSPEENEREP